MSKQEKGGQKKQQKPPQKAAGGGGSQKSNKSARDDGNEDVKREQKLQAVVLADNFLDNFNPITDNCPVILMPLGNIPIIEYTFELLVQGGVEEVCWSVVALLVLKYCRSSCSAPTTARSSKSMSRTLTGILSSASR